MFSDTSRQEKGVPMQRHLIVILIIMVLFFAAVIALRYI